jgi:hypothetical protein
MMNSYFFASRPAKIPENCWSMILMPGQLGLRWASPSTPVIEASGLAMT